MRSAKGAKRPHLRDIRDRNRNLVLRELLRTSGVSRHDLTGKTGLTHASVSRITKELIEEGLCYEGAAYRADNQLGRRRVELRVNPDGGFVLALCLSVFSRMAVITDITGRRRFETKIPARAARTAKTTIDHVGSWLDDLTASGEIDRSRLLGAGVVVAGSVDHRTGHLTNAPLLKWRNLPIRNLLSERLQCPVAVENVADALCLAYLDREYSGSVGHVHMFLVHVAFGMGASLVIDNKVVRRRGDEGWIGRLPLPGANTNADKRILHDASSGEAVLARLGKYFAEGRLPHGSAGITRRLKAAVDASNAGDSDVEDVFRQAGTALGDILLPITSAYFPDVIVLAGPVASSAAYRQAACAAYAKMGASLDYDEPDIVTNRTRYIEAAENLALRTHVHAVGSVHTTVAGA
jgi:predicted NBD/HSP70 family sugar kinase